MKTKIQQIKFFFIDVWGWVRSLFIYCFRTIKRPAIFHGYSSYYWACKFADKRTKKWSHKWDQMGRIQGVLPIDDTHLIVCSKAELKFYKKKKIVNKKLHLRKAIKKSYYNTTKL